MRYSAVCFTVCLLIALYISGCGDSTITDNDPNGCSKVPSLLFPPADTSISSSPVTFRWFAPTCGADYYKLYIYRDNFYDTIITPSTVVSQGLPTSFRYYWKVRAFYNSPKDSVMSSTYDFFLAP